MMKEKTQKEIMKEAEKRMYDPDCRISKIVKNIREMNALLKKEKHKSRKVEDK